MTMHPKELHQERLLTTTGRKKYHKYAGCNLRQSRKQTLYLGLCRNVLACEDNPPAIQPAEPEDGVSCTQVVLVSTRYVNSRCDRCIYITADCEYITTKFGPVHYNIHDDGCNYHVDDRIRNTCRVRSRYSECRGCHRHSLSIRDDLCIDRITNCVANVTTNAAMSEFCNQETIYKSKTQ